MASRVYRTGTIITRTNDLLKTGVLKTRPLWLDVVEAHPPLNLMKTNECPKPGKPPLITYPKDKLIREFFDRYKMSDGEKISLFENHQRKTIAERFVEIQLKFMSKSHGSLDQLTAAEKAEKILAKDHGIKLYPRTETVQDRQRLKAELRKEKREESIKDLLSSFRHV